MPIRNCRQILLTNFHSLKNAGDAALTSIALHQLEEAFPKAQISISMNEPQEWNERYIIHGSFFSWVKSNGKWNYKRLFFLFPSVFIALFTYRIFGFPINKLIPKPLRGLIKAYFDADIIVSIPGGFFYSSGHGITLAVTGLSLILAILAKKPLYILPQSIGPFRFTWEQSLARWIFNRARIVMVREEISREILVKCGISTSHIILLPDLAFSFEGASNEQALNWYKENDIDIKSRRPLLGITVIDWNAQSRKFSQQNTYEESITAAIRVFIEKYQGTAILFPQCWGPTEFEDDRIPTRRIANKLGDLSHSIIVVEKPISPQLLKSVFGQLDIFIGTRMHSNIFALSLDVPVIAIGYLHKTEGIAQIVGVQDWVIEIRQIDQELLVSKLNKLWEFRFSIRNELHQKMPSIREQSSLGGSIIANNYYSQPLPKVRQESPK